MVIVSYHLQFFSALQNIGRITVLTVYTSEQLNCMIQITSNDYYLMLSPTPGGGRERATTEAVFIQSIGKKNSDQTVKRRLNVVSFRA